jgi:hypothetical protein
MSMMMSVPLLVDPMGWATTGQNLVGVPERMGVAFVEVWVEAFAFVSFKVEGVLRSGTNLEVKCKELLYRSSE